MDSVWKRRVRSVLARSDRTAPSGAGESGSAAVDLVISSYLASPGIIEQLNDAAKFVESLRGSLGPKRTSVQRVRDDGFDGVPIPERFLTLVDLLEQGCPPLTFANARRIALIADEMGGYGTSIDIPGWSGDIGLHFALSSTSASSGRLLTTTARMMRSHACLELGTGYGMSALFIAASFMPPERDGTIDTIEFWQPQASLASAMLAKTYPDRVRCHQGAIAEVVPAITARGDRFDFVFHDASHTPESYPRDFTQFEPNVIPGGVVIFDDIRWGEDAEATYQGWLSVVEHPRVRQAVEIEGGRYGLLLLGA